MNIPEIPKADKTPRVRPVEASHIARLIAIGEETKLSPWSAEAYLDEIKNANSIMLRLADDDDPAIAFVVGRFVPASEGEPGSDAEIYNIAVVNDRQRQGSGQILLNAFLQICSERNARNIWLEVRESNQKAINFYSKNDFEPIQTRAHFYENPREHAVLMRRKLK